MKRILELHPETYRRHAIHCEGRIWAETNCYSDVWIELLHSLGHEPVAALPFTFAIDFEGDQWTFFKFPLHDLKELFCLEVQELAIWRPLATHIEEQLGRGRPTLVELDSFFLPDTAGAAYKKAHVKSTVAVTEIDVSRDHMGYFHNQGYYHVDGDDFLNVLHLGECAESGLLPPYVEFVKLTADVGGTERPLLQRSMQLLSRHLEAAPVENPFRDFKARFESDMDWLLKEGLDAFHLYSFATLRQFGACFELSHTYLQWLATRGQSGLEACMHAFREISEGAKVLQFQLARSVARHRPMDLSALDVMGERWQQGMDGLRRRYC